MIDANNFNLFRDGHDKYIPQTHTYIRKIAECDFSMSMISKYDS